ncbi:MAG: hypothetical protein LBN25_00850, partial [Christensenellaceae bacterium]|nr:hypothetical protein [Christensenellaceae bacterium]
MKKIKILVALAVMTALSVFALTACKNDKNDSTPEADNTPVYLQYVESGETLIPLLKQGIAEYGILGEPAATRAQAAAGVQIIGSLPEWWSEAHPEYTNFPQAVLSVSPLFVANGKNADFIRALYAALEENTEYIVENPSEAAIVLTEAGAKGLTPLSKETVERCNINPSSGALTEANIKTYLSALYELNPQA